MASHLKSMSDDTESQQAYNSVPQPIRCDLFRPPQTPADMSSQQSLSGSGSGSVDTSWFHKACKELLPPGGHGAERSRQTVGELSAVFTNTDNLWSGTPQILVYLFIDGNDTQRHKVCTVIDEWTWYANVIFREGRSAAESNIRIKFDGNDGSWSYVGKVNDRIAITDPTMNLGWIDKNSNLTQNERSVILHEFGHALGLLHEHQSPAHGGVAVTNIQAAIDLYSNTQGWDTQKIYDQVINVYQKSDVSNFSQVDTHSIMHYPEPKELTGLPEDIPYNFKLTDMDKAYMILQYPRAKVHPKAQAAGWCFEKALQIMGTPDEITQKVLRSLQADRDPDSGEISPINSRKIIEDWTRTAHVPQ